MTFFDKLLIIFVQFLVKIFLLVLVFEASINVPPVIILTPPSRETISWRYMTCQGQLIESSHPAPPPPLVVKGWRAPPAHEKRMRDPPLPLVEGWVPGFYSRRTL